MVFLRVWWRDWNERCIDDLDLRTILTALSILPLGFGIGNAPKMSGVLVCFRALTFCIGG